MGINDDENHIHIVKKLVKWFKDSLSSVRDLCHLVDVAIASIWAMDHGPMPNKARAGSLWKEFRSGQELAVVFHHPLVRQNYSYSSCPFSASLKRRRRWTSYSQAQWSAIFLYCVCWGFVHAVMNGGPIYHCSKGCFCLFTMQQHSHFSLESGVWVNQYSGVICSK